MPAPLPPPVVGERYACTSRHPSRRIEATVGRVDAIGDRVRVISVALKVKGDPDVPEIGHMPFDQETFRASCQVKLASHASLPSTFGEGYTTWRSAAGGFYTLSVDDAVDLVVDMVRTR